MFKLYYRGLVTPRFGDFMILSKASASSDYSFDFGTPVHALDAYAYLKNDLGATYSEEKTVFRFWSPEALAVSVKLYSTGSDAEAGSRLIKTLPMVKTSENIWFAEYSGDHKNEYYTYAVDFKDRHTETADIYAKAVGVNGDRGMIVDLAGTNPENWCEDKRIYLKSPTDAVIWEIHIKDFSHSPSSGVSEAHRGKYLAFCEHTTLFGEGVVPTCVDYLKKLGITHVQINPFYDFGSIDEASKDDSFNWGYDPKNYNAPEGSYSTNPYDGNVRITECKQMIKALHDAGIGVIMDVVYNHTFVSSGSHFDLSVPGYYYRYHGDGALSNGSGCGNDTASEHIMFRKFMVDSVLYWAEEYHLDGFRFDLMGLHDAETMCLIRKALDERFGKGKILLYGEGWYMSTASAYGTVMANQGAVRQMQGIGAFNDNIRDALKGSVFNAYDKGFIQCGSCADRIKRGILGEVGSWADKSSQCVNFVSCHDNYALYDKLILSENGGKGYSERFDALVSMMKLSASVLLTSRGIPFFLAGEEIARTKFGDENSFRSSAEINHIDWENTTRFADLLVYYQGLIALRKKLDVLRGSNEISDSSTLKFIDCAMPCICYSVGFDCNGSQGTIVVALNPCDYEVRINLSEISDFQDFKGVVLLNKHSAGTFPLSYTRDILCAEGKSATLIIDERSYNSIFKG